MKTPEEIKKAITCCMKAGFQPAPCKECPYYGSGDFECAGEMGEDALAYIQRLEERCEKWRTLAENLNDALKEHQRRHEDENA